MAEFSTLYSPSNISCKIQISVLYTVLDHYIRNLPVSVSKKDKKDSSKKEDRVVGALFGFEIDGSVEIRTSFPCIILQDKDNAIDSEYYQQMKSLHDRLNPKETLVGWYSSGIDLSESTFAYHFDFFGAHAPANSHLIHLTVDTELLSGKLDVNAYVGQLLAFENEKIGAEFRPISHEIDSKNVDVAALNLLQEASAESDAEVAIPSGFSNLENSLKKLISLIKSAKDYVEGVQSGAIPGDKKIGRQLLQTIESLGPVDDRFTESLRTNFEDLLMVVYLSNLTKTQLKIAEKIQNTVSHA